MRNAGRSLCRLLGAFAVGLSLQGCAVATIAVAGTVIGAGASVGIDVAVEQTLGGIAYRTYAAPVDDVHRATLGALARMGIPVTADQRQADGGRTLAATAADRTIDIRLERLTDKATRMRVVVNEGRIFFKDRATAVAIVTETSHDVPGAVRSDAIGP